MQLSSPRPVEQSLGLRSEAADTLLFDKACT